MGWRKNYNHICKLKKGNIKKHKALSRLELTKHLEKNHQLLGQVCIESPKQALVSYDDEMMGLSSHETFLNKRGGKEGGNTLLVMPATVLNSLDGASEPGRERQTRWLGARRAKGSYSQKKPKEKIKPYQLRRWNLSSSTPPNI